MLNSLVIEQKQYDISEISFRRVVEFVHSYSGIDLNDSKKELVKNRLRKRLKKQRVNSFHEYCNFLESSEGEAEIPFLIDAISTNITAFFRENAHYRFLLEHALPEVCSNLQSKKLRIWSAACSSGEEPFSIAMVVDTFLNNANSDVKILATDISDDSLKKAKSGIYSEEKVKDVPEYFLKNYFKELSDAYYKISADVADMVYFRKLNLNREEYPFKGKFDIIFCRNVMIYFDNSTQKKLIERFRNVLKSGGYLFLGHAESLSGKVDGFKFLAPAIYKKG